MQFVLYFFLIIILWRTPKEDVEKVSLFLSVVNVVFDPTDFHCMERKAIETVFKITFVLVCGSQMKVLQVFYDMSK